MLLTAAHPSSSRISQDLCSSGLFGARKCRYLGSSEALGPLRRSSTECLAVTSDSFEFPLPDDENTLLAEATRRRWEIAQIFKDQDTGNFWKRLKLQTRGFKNRLNELCRKKQLNEVFELLESATGVNKSLDRKTMNNVLETCVVCRNIYRAMQIFNKMAEPGACGLDQVSYGTIIKGLGQAGMLDKAFQIIESLENGTAPGGVRLSLIHLNTLINACANAGDAKRARAALIRYRSAVEDTGPSLVTYNMLIKGYARSDNPLEALKVREEMRLRGVRPNKITLNSLILAGVRGQDLDMAFEILEEMKETGKQNPELAPDVVSYTTLIRALAEGGDLKGVLNTVAEMKATKTCILDRVGYTSIIDACINAGSPPDGMRFLREMLELGVKPRAHAFLALMRAFAEQGDVEAVSSLRSEMQFKSSGYVWDEDRLVAEELLMEAAVNAGKCSVASEVLRTAILGLARKLQLSQRGYMALVRLQVMNGFADEPLLTPWIIKDEISLHDPADTVLSQLTPLEPLSPATELAGVISCLRERDVLPVVDLSGESIGTIHWDDYHSAKSSKPLIVRDLLRTPPPATLLRCCPVSMLVKALLQPGAAVIRVDGSNGRSLFISRKDALQLLSPLNEGSEVESLATW